MQMPLESAFLLDKVRIVIPAIFFFGVVWPSIPPLRRLYRFIALKIHEYQSLDRGDFLTLLIDAGMSHEEARWFYDTFYADVSWWKRFCIKRLIKKYCF